MLVRYQLLVHRLFLTTLILLAALIGHFLSVSVIAFQKTAMITPVDNVAGFVATGALSGASFHPNIRKLLGPIPYQNSKAIYDILPVDRFHKTIQMGYGNCSNVSFGMAFWLLQQHHEFQIVHLLPYDSFLVGNGHTVLKMSYELDGAKQMGIVDVLAGGLPRSNGIFIDLPLMQQKKLDGISILQLNSRTSDLSSYYSDFLNNAAVGVVPSEEIKRYFDFVERVYIPLSSKRLERIIFSGMAIIFDRYPHTYVSREDYARLFEGRSTLIWAAQSLIWLLRLMPGLALLSLTLSFLRMRQSRETVTNLRVLVRRSVT